MMPEPHRGEWPFARRLSTFRLIGTALLLALASSTVLLLVAVARGTFTGSLIPF